MEFRMASDSSIQYWRSRFIGALMIPLIVLVPLHAHAAGDLHDLYNALQTKGRAVSIPAQVLKRLKLALPASDISGKEIVVTETDGDKRGITSFGLGGVSYLTMFHIETDNDDSWLLRFNLDGRILNQEWEEGGYRTYEIQSPQIAEREIGFWRHWMTGKAGPSP
jgi:hypothetical protein